MRQTKAMLRLWLLVVTLVIASSQSRKSKDPDFEFSRAQPRTGDSDYHDGVPFCTMDQLTPQLDEHISDGWSLDHVPAHPYDCTCPFLKASYFCPHLGNATYPFWQPIEVANGNCRVKDRPTLREAPFPPHSKILFYGNSHLRQVVEGIMCMFGSTVSQRKVAMTMHGSLESDSIKVDRDWQCRGTSLSQRHVLVDYGCLSEDDSRRACSCDDNSGVYKFENRAIVHYHFAHKQEHKKIEEALMEHGRSYEDYDMVFANLGNEPRMTVSNLLNSAREIQKADVPFFWLSAYEGEGDIRYWTEEEQEEFWNAGARFIPVHDMMNGFTYLTKGYVEDELNPHFCMPGPPNELGVLLLRLIWAHLENT